MISTEMRQSRPDSWRPPYARSCCVPGPLYFSQQRPGDECFPPATTQRVFYRFGVNPYQESPNYTDFWLS